MLDPVTSEDLLNSRVTLAQFILSLKSFSCFLFIVMCFGIVKECVFLKESFYACYLLSWRCKNALKKDDLCIEIKRERSSDKNTLANPIICCEVDYERNSC